MATESQTSAICETCAYGIGYPWLYFSASNFFCAFSWLNTKIAHFESIMQNKPNLLNAQMNASSFITKDYENIANWKLGENKPNSKPIKANTKPIRWMLK